MRVLHLISDTDRRGAQVFAEQLHQRLAADHRIDGALVALTHGDGASTVDATLAPRGIRARRRQFGDYDLVLAHGSTTLDAAAALAPGRFVYRSIGDPTFWLDRTRRRVKTRALLGRAAHVVALYPAAATALQTLAGVDEAALSVIPNAVEVDPAAAGPAPRAPLGIPDDAPVALYVGAVSWEKRVEVIIDAVAGLDDVHLVTVGDGPRTEAVDALGRERLGDRWHPVGAIDDPLPYYALADVLVLASLTEGQPGTILEAAHVATPTVAPRVGGIPSMIEDGVSGRLYTYDDELGPAIADALATHEALGSAMWDRLEDAFSMERVTAAWAEVLRRSV